MTRIRDQTLIATPCCHALYSTPQYSSINLGAQAYWTDGENEYGLMPRGGGLRKCKCGQYYLLREAIKLGIEAGPDTPHSLFVHAADLADAIRAPSPSVELVARREYWKHLNDPYRELYRAHRQAEDKTAQEKWDSERHAAHPDKRPVFKKFLDLLLRKKPVGPPPMNRQVFSVPPYQPSALQIQNMERLLELLLDGRHEKYGPDYLEVAELYRELGRFKEAKAALERSPKDDRGATDKVIERLILSGQTAPTRYRM